MSFKRGICTLSLGQYSAGHHLPEKLRAARANGIHGVEIFDEDLWHLSESFPGGRALERNHYAAAAAIRHLCEANELEIICLQPFRHYEGILDRAQHKRRFAELRHCMRLAQVLGTDLLLIPSSFLPQEQLSTSDDDHVADLIKAADLGARMQPPIRICYEALCWGTRVDVWEQSWEVVTRVDRPNFGMCIDTFNLAGRVFADPSSATGTTPNAEQDMAESMRRLVQHVDIRKVFLVQLGDAARLSKPLVPGHALYNADQPTRMSWSRHCRLFYGEQHLGGYLPVREIMAAVIVGLGYDGWVSYEIFNHRLSDTGSDIPEEMARRAVQGFDKLQKDMVPLSEERRVGRFVAREQRSYL